MALTIEQLARHIAHTIPGGLSTQLPGVEGQTTAEINRQIINEAGRHMVGSRRWEWRERPSIDLDLVQDEPFVELPADFGSLLGITFNSLTTSICLTTHQSIINKRAKSLTPVGFMYWAAIVHPSQADDDEAPPPPRIEIYPTPNTSESGVITVTYLADWVDFPSGDNDLVANVPVWMESLLIQYIRAFANAYDDSNTGLALAPLLEEIEKGPLYEAALRRDGMTQSTLGPVTNGAAQVQPLISPFEGRPIADPA